MLTQPPHDLVGANALVRTPNIPDPDGFYEELIESQRALTDDQAQDMNCRLILLLANHIGDRAVLSAALKAAARERG